MCIVSVLCHAGHQTESDIYIHCLHSTASTSSQPTPYSANLPPKLPIVVVRNDQTVSYHNNVKYSDEVTWFVMARFVSNLHGHFGREHHEYRVMHRRVVHQKDLSINILLKNKILGIVVYIRII